MCYVDTLNKICFSFTPRGGCSISFQLYLDLLGLLNDGLKYNSFIHIYRMDLFNKNIPFLDIEYLIKEKYLFIKFIMNPYIRAVSVFRAQTSHNLSFREYIKKLVNKNLILNKNDIYHHYPQYLKEEEKIINKYIIINENEKYTIKLKNGDDYIIDVNKYTSFHHGTKTENKNFCGDLPLNEIYNNLPCSYKYFYDDEIKKNVEIFYKDDIEKYNFSFDF